MPKSHVFKTKLVLSPVYTALNFWYGTDKIGTRAYLDSPGTKEVVRYRGLSVV
jgi:hypothetical protein